VKEKKQIYSMLYLINGQGVYN